MWKFIIDTQLPPRLATFLTEKGYDARHTTAYQEGNLMKDYTIRRIAIAEDRIIITKDSDFLDDYLLKGNPPKVLMLQVGNITNQALTDIIEKHIDKIIQLLEEKHELLILQTNHLSGYYH